MLRSCGFQFWRVARSPPGSDRQRAYINLCRSSGRTMQELTRIHRWGRSAKMMKSRLRRKRPFDRNGIRRGISNPSRPRPFVVQADTHDVVGQPTIEVRGEAGSGRGDGLELAEVDIEVLDLCAPA